VGPRRARQRVGVAADGRVRRHVVDAVVGPGLRERRGRRVGGGGQAVEIVVAVGPALAPGRGGDAQDAARRIAGSGKPTLTLILRRSSSATAPGSFRQYRALGGSRSARSFNPTSSRATKKFKLQVSRT
jgi:hypothetical protein